jgi:2-polyprenyl-3-methyl-5-hydroxy-6-metoxy-1,4-benzoquinol methylase
MGKRVPDGENPDPIGKHTLKIISGATRFNHWMYSEIKPLLKGNILEIGSGIGNISRHIIKDGFPVTLSDYNPEYYRQTYFKKNRTFSNCNWQKRNPG